MTEPITPNQLRRLFPGASKSVLARNPLDAEATRSAVPSEPKSEAATPEFSLLVTIPVPNPKLNPNARVVWPEKQRLVRECRANAKHIALVCLGAQTSRFFRPMLPKATVLVRWFHRTTHRLDATNLIGTLKSVEDGLTDAEIWKDDCGVTWLPPEQFTDKENPRVELLITEP